MILSDLAQYVGADISASASGDLQPCQSTLRGQQRVLRRLLTNPGDYIFHPEYGAGLPAKIGTTANLAELRALVRGQMFLEAAVARTPEPQINVAPIPNTAGGGFAVGISYTDAPTGETVVLSFNVSN